MAKGHRRGFSSIKSKGSIKQRKSRVEGKSNLGTLKVKYPQIDEVLYSHTMHSEWIYDDMDCSVEEFSDMTGADLDELLKELSDAIKGF